MWSMLCQNNTEAFCCIFSIRRGNMNNILHRLHHWLRSYRGHLFLAILACSFIPLLFMGYLSYRFVYRLAFHETLQNAVRMDNRLNDQLETRIRQVETVANSMQYNVYSIGRRYDSTDSINALIDARSTVSMYIDAFDFLHILVYLPEGNPAAAEGVYYFPADQLADYSFASSLSSHSGTSSIWFFQDELTLPEIVFGNSPYRNLIGCARINAAQGENTLSPSFVILLKTEEFSDMIRSSYDDTDISGFLMDPEGYVLAHSDTQQEGTFLSADETSALIEHAQDGTFLSDGIYYHVQPLSNGWYQVAEIPIQYVFSALRNTVLSLLTVFLLALVCILVVTQILSKTLTKRLNHLSNAMNSYVPGSQIPDTTRNNLIQARSPSRYDEFDRLGNAFLAMDDSIRNSTQSLIELSLSKERLRYQLLQSQINPHFLYNILGTIRTCNSLGKTAEANQMIDDLTQFYRMTLHKSQEMIPIKDEIQIARLYLQLEQICHSNSLHWEFNTEDGIENFYICKFTLQPFLENSIHYGYSASINSICITVDIEYDEDVVQVSIRDNGAGISDEKLAELRTMLEQHTVNTEKHFGIGSVASRIASPSYGNGVIQIEQVPEGGTLVQIRFAQIMDFEEPSV